MIVAQRQGLSDGLCSRVDLIVVVIVRRPKYKRKYMEMMMRIIVERRQDLAASLSFRIDRRRYQEDTEKEKERGDDHHRCKMEARLVERFLFFR